MIVLAKEKNEAGGESVGRPTLDGEAGEGKAAHRAELGESVPDERKSRNMGVKAVEEPRHTTDSREAREAVQQESQEARVFR